MRDVCDYIARIQSASHLVYQKIHPEISESLHDHGITPTQLFVLSLLKTQGRCSISQLADHLGVKPSAVTFMMDRLEQNKLIMREHDQKDRRVVNIRLTKQGENMLETILESRKAIITKYLSYLTEDELSFMAETAEKLANYTEKEQMEERTD
ncbi:MarR family transcriptional regulator [Bacillus smithii]|uniref:MarR family winged helix-turn-helix transcriptional regulator n=1 Tax=Bacillus smithii TaxID=1479 RepID=UPI002E1F4F05|nr:MarR family transcriptional regulator [Bacillus smithii]